MPKRPFQSILLIKMASSSRDICSVRYTFNSKPSVFCFRLPFMGSPSQALMLAPTLLCYGASSSDTDQWQRAWLLQLTELPRRSILISTMRHILVVLMIALLPLRGWASETMVVSMAVQQLVVAQMQTVDEAGMPADCPLFGQASKTSTTGTNSETISPLCKGCTTCQLCMALVTGYAPMPGIAAHLPHAVRRVNTFSFTSAERAPGFKPPIS